MALSIMADAEGKFIEAVGAETAEGIEHFQPAPPLGTPNYKRFQHMMGATDENALYLFAGNTHDQVCTLALAMDKAKSTESLTYTKQIPVVCNAPGEKVDDILTGAENGARRNQDRFHGSRIGLRFRRAR
jgi:branched-chain amino acid transport system substrate-binding protein